MRWIWIHFQKRSFLVQIWNLISQKSCYVKLLHLCLNGSNESITIWSHLHLCAHVSTTFYTHIYHLFNLFHLLTKNPFDFVILSSIVHISVLYKIINKEKIKTRVKIFEVKLEWELTWHAEYLWLGFILVKIRFWEA